MIPRFAGQAAGRTLMYGVALAFAASPAQAQAPANEKMAQISSGLDDFIRDELNIRNVGFTIDREVISMAVNVGQDGPEMLMGKVSLLASAAGAAAPWTRELQLSVYSGNAPLAFIRIPTAQITAYAEGRIDLTQYLDSWQFSGVDDVAGGEPEPNGFKLSVASLCGSDREFVRSVYHAIAEREPAEWELNAHVQRLQGGVLRGRIVSDLLLAKNNSGAGFMADAIQAIYGRQPTPGELASWPRSRRATIIADMLGSPEHVGRTRSCAGRWRE